MLTIRASDLPLFLCCPMSVTLPRGAPTQEVLRGRRAHLYIARLLTARCRSPDLALGQVLGFDAAECARLTEVVVGTLDECEVDLGTARIEAKCRQKYCLRGVIDLYWQKAGTTHVLDWKYSVSDPEYYLPQLLGYVILLRLEHAVAHLVDLTSGNIVTYTFTPEHLRTFIELYRKLYAEVQQKHATCVVGSWCAHCSAVLHCSASMETLRATVQVIQDKKVLYDFMREPSNVLDLYENLVVLKRLVDDALHSMRIEVSQAPVTDGTRSLALKTYQRSQILAPEAWPILMLHFGNDAIRACDVHLGSVRKLAKEKRIPFKLVCDDLASVGAIKHITVQRLRYEGGIYDSREFAAESTDGGD